MSKPRTTSISDLVQQEQQNEKRARHLPSIVKSTPIRSGPSSVSQGRGTSVSSSVNGVSRNSMAEAPPSGGSSVGASSLPRFPFSGIGRATATPNNSGSNTTVSGSPYSSPAQQPSAVTRRSSSLDSINAHHKGDTGTSKAYQQRRSSPSPSSPLSRPSVSGPLSSSSSSTHASSEAAAGSHTQRATQTSAANGMACSSSFAVFDTRTNRRVGVSGPAKWRGTSVNAKLLHSQTSEACVMKQSYQQFICLKVLLAESRRYAWSNIVLRHPEAATDEVLVFQFNSTWCQLVDDVTTAIVERHVSNVSAASAIVNMMELFQRHSPAVDLLPDCTQPIGPRHLPIDWYEAQRQEVRNAVVEERQARKGRAVAKAMCSLRPSESQMMRRL